jgi:hypothetical protein
MRSDVRRVFGERFATSVIEKQYDSILSDLLVK